MKTIKLFVVDAFASEIFKGNPAAVIEVENWPSDDLLLNIARENAIAETAFYKNHGDYFHLRWFTPEIEMDLCGHATLAASHVIFSKKQNQTNDINFETKSGNLTIRREDQNKYAMNFPSRKPVRAELPDVIKQGLNVHPISVYKSRDYILLYETEMDIINLKPNQQIINQINLDPGGICVTAIGSEFDFVSRYFTPQSSIFEDPVTGSSFSSLIPFWAERLSKTEMIAKQVSSREGIVYCKDFYDRVELSGYVKTYFVGSIYI